MNCRDMLDRFTLLCNVSIKDHIDLLLSRSPVKWTIHFKFSFQKNFVATLKAQRLHITDCCHEMPSL